MHFSYLQGKSFLWSETSENLSPHQSFTWELQINRMQNEMQKKYRNSSSSPGTKHMNNRLPEFKVTNCLLVSGGYKEYFKF